MWVMVQGYARVKSFDEHSICVQYWLLMVVFGDVGVVAMAGWWEGGARHCSSVVPPAAEHHNRFSREGSTFLDSHLANTPLTDNLQCVFA